MKESKKLIRHAIEGALTQAVVTLGLSAISKKTQMLIRASSKKISAQVKSDLKKRHKKEARQKKEAEKKSTKKIQAQIK